MITLKAAIFASGILLFLSGCYLSLYGAMNLTVDWYGVGAIALGLVMVRAVDKEK